ncbi:sigma-54 interaction domain-containing protein [Azohydromonas aeria]|uniref:sigma-54 interaction domain-containing protein n=1 Tax=Azohydromonas aeria TaxID=2590212 RepID=UPI0012FC3C50|nr:sigma-54 dependent transcriptional regulator [Azohydromonas aeria]
MSQTTPSFSVPELSVAVCSSQGQQERAQVLSAMLRGGGLRAGASAVAGFGVPLQGTGLVLQLVGPEDFGPALRQLTELRVAQPCCPVLVAASAQLAPQALDALLHAGASDFLREPASDADVLLRVRRALGVCGAAAPALPLPAHPALHNLIGDSPAFAQQVARVPVLARYDASVLILGDTGTGKEVCAQAIHYLSARAGGPWVAVNCGAIPGELVEAELFGHVKGAYTHAHASRAGLVREAEGGTLFLDEIDSLPYGAQAKLLRFLQEKEYRPVGSSQLARANVRVIAATNRNPAALVAQGCFRQDLLFRLNVLTLHLPPLRERRSDIAPLAQYFLRCAARQWVKPAPALSPAALNKLLAHDWPGNVRELRNVMERAVLMSGATLLGAAEIDLDGCSAAPAEAPAAAESFRAAKARVVESFERSYIEQLLASTAGNVTHAARAARKNRRAFFELMRKYKLDAKTYREAS